MNKIKTLIPLSEFVSKIDEICPRETDQMYDLWRLNQLGLIIRYNNFLLQPLNIGMFVPADEDGNFLEDPYNDGENMYYGANIEGYKNAKSRVLFEGFEWNNQGYAISKEFSIDEEMCISLLDNIGSISNTDVILTEQALKQIYG